MTIRELAKRAGVAKSSIEAMESALPNPTLRMLYSVARALEVSIQDRIRRWRRVIRLCGYIQKEDEVQWIIHMMIWGAET